MKIEYFSIRISQKPRTKISFGIFLPYRLSLALNFKVEINECVPLLQEQSKQDLLPSHECHMCNVYSFKVASKCMENLFGVC